ncbi:alpha-ketoacid dehydrogenase subunit beta [Bacterioplanes sanyensis]|uniref:2-oxoisovalerate dehydrogenase subunit beta n=1 Tax=Bacterioplanes sanyensis TaxID=1249553 RepID=A0A222FL98_9GAMM|nr:alpha-ketoacid dehydrogenase subunit beta [Bacterioplanes sanyensis]ASP39366.1 alpha-ketoacid dehydrogenase subunit beta [Bacterioplanes sanyensis]
MNIQDKTMVEAVNLALHHAMGADERVVCLGEDIGVNGGVFRATVDLQQRFGEQRVMDTPLAETLIAGSAIGMAATGLRPVMEIQFMGFIFPAFEQLITHAARLRNRTRGRMQCPLVVRAPFGGGIHAPEHHSESTEALLAHIPGIRVVIPSSPRRAYGLLLSAIDDPDPVVFLEPKRLYRIQKQPLADDGERLPLDTCFTLRQGSDITLISWGASVRETLLAADRLQEQNISAEVIDVATVSPIDIETLCQSVARTGRCLIVHEACRSGGIGADIAAQLSEQVFDCLQAPIQRVTGFDTPMPYFRQEQWYLADPEDIVHAAVSVVHYQ